MMKLIVSIQVASDDNVRPAVTSAAHGDDDVNNGDWITSHVFDREEPRAVLESIELALMLLTQAREEVIAEMHRAATPQRRIRRPPNTH